jgi:hypothetical protein
MQKPEVFPVGTPHPRFVLKRFTAGEASMPRCQHSLYVFRMNKSRPAPTLQIFFTDPKVFKPALIEKTVIAIRVRTVQKRRGNINDAPQ